MKVIVDKNTCEAHGECVLAAPEVFDLDDDDDTVTVLQEEPSADLREKVEEAVRNCPVDAIRLEA